MIYWRMQFWCAFEAVNQICLLMHTPGSLKNVMCEEEGVLRLLPLIPGINIKVLPETVHCCVSAGSYMLKHPKMAQALLDKLLSTVLETQPDYLVSSNIGCLLHTGAGLRIRGIRMETIHPVVLFARQLADLCQVKRCDWIASRLQNVRIFDQQLLAFYDDSCDHKIFRSLLFAVFFQSLLFVHQ